MMQVYGDSVRRETAAALLARLRSRMDTADASRGLARHSALATLLIEAGVLAQGIADAQFHAIGKDANSAAIERSMELVMALARCCAESWGSELARHTALPRAELQACEALGIDAPLELKQPEGYAYYALYPESYFEAALHCRSARGRESAGAWQVIGLRSIGTSLAAMVAVGLGAGPPRTLRPVGHPFHRRIEADRVRDTDTLFAIVDEGPGLSGSSLTAAVRWLLDAGVPASRIHLFPGHGGAPGPQADEETRRLWSLVPKWPADFANASGLFEHRLSDWVSTQVGSLDAPLQDIGNGAWRSLQPADRPMPPAHPWQERRKYLAPNAQGRWLVKFAGLGRHGEHAWERAQALGAAGFSPEPMALCHGYLVERWRHDMAPLPATLPDAMRSRLTAWIARYLAFRARHFAAPEGSGAPLEQLHAMGRHNTTEALGEAAATAWDRWKPLLSGLEARVRRIETDNRMHAWEWLSGSDTFLKTDAVDHHASHNLIGCQDVAWDVVGACVEFALAPSEEQSLIEHLGAEGVVLDGELLRCLRPCYLAFHLGHFQMAIDGCAPAEASILKAHRERYTQGLKACLLDCR